MRNQNPFEAQIEKARAELRDLESKQEEIRKWPMWLAQAGMHWKDFCAKYGFHQSQISLWMNGKVLPEWESITPISDALKIEAEAGHARQYGAGA